MNTFRRLIFATWVLLCLPVFALYACNGDKDCQDRYGKNSVCVSGACIYIMALSDANGWAVTTLPPGLLAARMSVGLIGHDSTRTFLDVAVTSPEQMLSVAEVPPPSGCDEQRCKLLGGTCVTGHCIIVFESARLEQVGVAYPHGLSFQPDPWSGFVLVP